MYTIRTHLKYRIQWKKAAKELKMQKSKTIKASQCVRSSENCSLESRPNGQFNFRSWIRWEETLAVIFLRTNVRWSASSFFSQQDKNITALGILSGHVTDISRVKLLPFILGGCLIGWLVDWVLVLCRTRHKIGHFGDVSQSQSLCLV